ncbi:hypothetical protein BDR26DRAFT_848873 [Obelidium mucronatum]|nr:hypothetical protein BDR26DRAFT_848873 [Obelidium mucronatum]
MSTRHERMNNKSLNDQHSKILKELMQRADNRKCVDCRKKDPRWASWNLGVFMCIRCSGVHRSIGTHITKVKSADLDAWTPEQIESMLKWGNARANAYWEGSLPANFEGPSEAGIDAWIRDKYDGKRFALRGPIPDPETIPLPAGIASVSVSRPSTAAAPVPQASFAQICWTIFQGPASTPAPSSNATAPFTSTSATTATATNTFKSDIMSLYSNPQAQQPQTQQQQQFQFPVQQQQQQQQQQAQQPPQLAGLQFFSNTQPSQSFANFASFPSTSSQSAAPGFGLGNPLQPALGSALLPGSKAPAGGIPDFMGLGNAASNQKRGSLGGADKDVWGEFQ